MRKIVLNFFFSFLLVSTITSSSFSQHFTKIWNGNPYSSMNIVITQASINGAPLESGDEIAAFDVGDNGIPICVGITILTKQSHDNYIWYTLNILLMKYNLIRQD